MSVSPGESQEQSQQQVPQVRLSAEELRVLKECNQESFWYRCVPLGVLFIGSSQILVNRGAGFLAFVVGKWSYRNECKEKIMQLENSPLADALRRGKGGIGEAIRDQAVYERSMINDGSRQRGQLSEFPTQQRGLDDNLRPSVDGGVSSAPKPTQSDSNRVTYEELRRQNRTDYEKKRYSGAGTQDEMQPIVRPLQPTTQQRGSQSSVEPSRKRNTKRNQFGDEIETDE